MTFRNLAPISTKNKGYKLVELDLCCTGLYRKNCINTKVQLIISEKGAGEVIKMIQPCYHRKKYPTPHGWMKAPPRFVVEPVINRRSANKRGHFEPHLESQSYGTTQNPQNASAKFQPGSLLEAHLCRAPKARRAQQERRHIHTFLSLRFILISQKSAQKVGLFTILYYYVDEMGGGSARPYRTTKHHCRRQKMGAVF